MATVAELLELAVAQHQSGSLAQAEALYRQIIDADPRHADARHLLGLLAHQGGHHDAAVVLIREAIALKPSPLFYSNLGLVLGSIGQRDDAVASFREAVRLGPNHAEAWENLGNALREGGAAAEAVQCFRQALRLNPSRAETHNNLGAALQELGQMAEAIAWYEQALHHNPQLTGARANLANAYNGLGGTLVQQGRQTEAAQSFRRALAFDPDHAHARNNLGVALKDLGQLDEAATSFRDALGIDPGNVDAGNNLAIVLEWLGCRDEARAQYEATLRLQPGHVGTRFNRGLLRLLEGNFEGGWPDYELRLQLPGALEGQERLPRWNGSSFAGKTLLIRAEQGLGDAIQFARYVPLVNDRGGKVVVECHPRLVELFARLRGADQVIAMGAPPPCDIQVPLMSLPLIFNTTVTTIPANVPYLSANSSRLARWREELRSLPGLKVGIVWQGNPANDKDRYRSLPLARLEPLARAKGISLVSLQVGPGAEQLTSVSFPITDLGRRFDGTSLGDLAAALMSVDLVVAVESAVAHLAGALGVPIWTMLAYTPDWRWLLERADSPWYPTMRLFRQTRVGDWDEVIARIAAALAVW